MIHINEELKTQQINIEKESRLAVQAKTKKRLDEYVKTQSEYNTSYGKKAVKEIIPVIRKYLIEIINTPKLQWHFLKAFLRPTHKFEVDNKIDKKEDNVVDSISHMTAVNIVASLSSEPTFTALLRSLTDNLSRMYDFGFEEMDTDAMLKFDKATMTFFKAIIHHIEANLNIIEIYQDEDTDVYSVLLRDEWKAIIKETNNATLLSVAAYTPMVYPPNPHTSLLDKSGGHITEYTPLLRDPTRINGRIDKSIVEFNSDTNPDFFEEINRLQETPYQVNTPLFKIIDHYHKQGKFFPKYPTDMDQVQHIYSAKAKDELDGWDKARRAKAEREEDYEYKEIGPRQVNKVIGKYNLMCMASVSRTTEIMDMAKEFSEYEAIWFALYLDSRSRRYTYVHTGSLTYMGCSLSKALLVLHDKEAFTIAGIRHMYAHLANALGYDKESLEMKIPKAIEFWVKHRSDFMNGNFEIFFDHDNGMDDAPNALAVCVELVEYAKDPNYKSGYIGHKDGRCSGASIIGTMLQDKRAMALTSVFDEVGDKAEKLPDAYTNAAEMGRAMNTEQYFEDNHEVLFGRSAWKTPTMTRNSYGCSESTIHKGKDEKQLGGNMKLFKDNGLDMKQCGKFTKLMMKALDATLPGCAMYLNAIQAASKEILLMGNVWKYHTPFVGFPVVRRKFITKKQVITTPKGYLSVNLVIHTPTDALSMKDSLQAVAPDLVHSIDATLLMLVGQDMKIPMACVHDSIGCHPNHNDRLVASYSNAMYRVAKERVLDGIFEELGTSIKAPFIGSITEEELEQVKESKHSLT